MTPARQRKSKADQYFDVGKVGRRTGVTLPDTGARDEHGMEPMSGIFSSPMSPQRNTDTTLTSSDMHVQDSSAPEVNQTLILRKTPKLPPPRASTPRHTNIGSPKRMSTGGRSRNGPIDQALEPPPSSQPSKIQPPANRMLNFGANAVRKSIEESSPFKPKRTTRRSTLTRVDPFAIPEEEDENADARCSRSPHSEGAENNVGESSSTQRLDDGPVLLDDDDAYQAPLQDSGIDIDEVQAEAAQEPPLEQRRGRPRKSGDSISGSQVQHSSSMVGLPSGRKRTRGHMESENCERDVSVSQASIDGAHPTRKQKRGRSPKNNKVAIHREGYAGTIDPSLLAYDNEHGAVDSHDPSEQSLPNGQRRKGKAAAPKERDPNRAMRPTGSPVKLNNVPERSSTSPSKRMGSRGFSMGPFSITNMRATTPFEDAGGRQSRFGRNIIEPLKWWANETKVYRHGEVQGILRAEEVDQPKRKLPKRRGRKSKKGISELKDIDEESEVESVMADEWEEDIGVIAGTVANWDSQTQMGNPHDPVTEDLAFASSSIIVRDVANSTFKYAKIMTLPFFGSGIVELPPAGEKRAKNSRKMQMVFFVHDGKVMVEVGAQGMEEINQFAVSKGGVWVVPRGNDYAITNESRTRTARIFFAQGSEVSATDAG